MMITRVNGVRAVIGPIPSGFGPTILVGELRNGGPLEFQSRYHEDFHPALLVAPNTVDGLGSILRGLSLFATRNTLRAVS